MSAVWMLYLHFTTIQGDVVSWNDGWVMHAFMSIIKWGCHAKIRNFNFGRKKTKIITKKKESQSKNKVKVKFKTFKYV